MKNTKTTNEVEPVPTVDVMKEVISGLLKTAALEREKAIVKHLNKPQATAQIVAKQDLRTIETMINSIDEKIDGKIKNYFNLGHPVADRLVSLVMTLQYLDKKDKEKVDPSVLMLVSQIDRTDLISKLGNPPYYHPGSALVAADIINADLIAGEYVPNNVPNAEELQVYLGSIAIDLGLLTVDFSNIVTQKNIDAIHNRALKKAKADKLLAETLADSVDGDEINYEE